MIRALFLLTSLAAMLMAITAVLIRIELAYPGISPLFTFAKDASAGIEFSTVSTAHALFAYLAVVGGRHCGAKRAPGANNCPDHAPILQGERLNCNHPRSELDTWLVGLF